MVSSRSVALVAALLTCGIGSARADESASVFRLKSGRSLEAELIEETPTSFVVKINNVRTVLPRSQVTSVKKAVPVKSFLTAEVELASRDAAEVAPARAQPARSGAAIARAIEEGEHGADGLEALTEPEKRAFVEWARGARARGGWTRLAPALARLGTPEAVAELAVTARSGTNASKAALGGVVAVASSSVALAWPHLVEGLGTPARVLCAAHRNALVELIARRTPECLAQLRRTLPSRPPADARLDETAWRAAVALQVGEVVAEAAADAPSFEPFAREASTLVPPAQVGIARALARRSDVSAFDARTVLQVLVVSPDPRVRAEAVRAFAAREGALDDEWGPRLIELLDEAEPALVRDAAWEALKAKSGQPLEQSARIWSRWWTQGRAR